MHDLIVLVTESIGGALRRYEAFVREMPLETLVTVMIMVNILVLLAFVFSWMGLSDQVRDINLRLASAKQSLAREAGVLHEMKESVEIMRKKSDSAASVSSSRGLLPTPKVHFRDNQVMGRVGSKQMPRFGASTVLTDNLDRDRANQAIIDQIGHLDFEEEPKKDYASMVDSVLGRTDEASAPPPPPMDQ